MSLMDGQSQSPGNTPGPNHFEPDTEVSMQSPPPPLPSMPSPVAQAAPIAPTVATQPEPHFFRQDSAEPSFTPSSAAADETAVKVAGSNEVSWEAAEFVAHSKSPTWYFGLAGVTIVISSLAFLIGRDLITVAAVIICAVLFGFMAARQPRLLEYSLAPNGIYVGNKFYPYSDFSAFSVLDEPSSLSIDFMPLKRFAPILTVAYDPQIEPTILEVLTQHLPYANHKRSLTDDLMHRIRF